MFFTILVFAGLLAPFLVGCSTYFTARRTTKKIARDAVDIVTFDDTLRKSVGLVKFENWSYYKRDDIEQVFQKKLAEILKSACPELLIAKPEDENYPTFLAELPLRVADRIDNLSLALLGRQNGFDAIVTGAVVNISAYEEMKGFFWMRDTHSYVHIQFLLEVFDTETGAKLLDENFIHELEVDESDYEFVRDKRPTTVVEIPEATAYVATDLGEKLCDALSGQPWKSYVLSMDGNRVVIAAGSNTGLEKDMELEVFNPGEIIEGTQNKRFFLPGPKSGEIRITRLHPDHAEAETTLDNGIQVGGTVRLK